MGTTIAAQGSGGSFRIESLKERLLIVTPGWQSESSGWSFFLSGCNGCSGHLTHNWWM